MTKTICIVLLLTIVSGLATGCFTEAPKKSDAAPGTVSQEKADAVKSVEPGDSSRSKPVLTEKTLPKPEPCTSCNGKGVCGSCGGNGKGIGGKKCSFCDGKGVCWSCKGTGKRG